MEDHSPHSLKAARTQRRKMSMPEGLLWQHLRQKPLGMKFRNHHPVGDLVVDFYCAAKRVAVELDGISHDMGEQPVHDERRDEWLGSQGIEVVRIPATDVLRDPAEIAESLAKYCSAKPPPSAAGAAATSPKGENLE